MKLLILSRYDRLGASSRLRTMQYLPWLEAAGINAQIEPFFDDFYLQRLYAGRRSGIAVAGYYLRRATRLLQAERPDAIWLEKELLPWLPAGIEQLLLPSGVPMVSDYDDAVFHRYNLHPLRVVRGLLGRKIDRVMARSALVLAGNPYLAGHARTVGAREVEIVPTVVDVHAYDTAPICDGKGSLRVGWIGTPGTWKQYMLPMRSMLTDLAARNGAVLRTVGAGNQAEGQGIESLSWSEESESRMIQGMDIGLMPLDDTPWSRGKCGYKIIQYMACGLPVVASPVGVNAEIVEHGVTGFLATSETEWREALTTLLRDRELRRRMGAAGRRKIEAQYSLQVWGPRVAALLAAVVHNSH